MTAAAADRAVARHRRQGGFTLIELIIATAIGLIVMAALTSVVITTVLADNVATEFARNEGNAFVVGNGTSKPKGFLSYTNNLTYIATRELPGCTCQD